MAAPAAVADSVRHDPPVRQLALKVICRVGLCTAFLAHEYVGTISMYRLCQELVRPELDNLGSRVLAPIPGFLGLLFRAWWFYFLVFFLLCPGLSAFVEFAQHPVAPIDLEE
jgi:hypothetical protein